MKTTASTAPLPAPRAQTARGRVFVGGVVLTAAVVAAYANSLGAPFVYDDGPAIRDNPTIRQLWPLWDVLLPQAEGGLTVSGRPLLNLSLALNYAISGTAEWSYHALNTLVHAGAVLLLFGLVRRTLARREPAPAAGAISRRTDALPLALAIAGLWALHPLQTQAVTYTVQRAESLMGFFYLLTLYAFARGAEINVADNRSAQKTRTRWFGLATVACAAGMATKEVMATAPLLVLLYDRTFVAGSFRAAWRERRGVHLALAATWLLLAALVLSTGGNRGGTVGLGVGVPLWAYPLTQFQAVARYLQLALWPHPLVFEYGTFWVQRAGDIVPYALVVLPLLAGTAFALWKKPVLGFAGAWFFGILAPTSLAPGTIQMIVEHRMYLPLAAVATLAALTLHRWTGRALLPVCAVVAVGLGGLTALRNHDYRSHLALWSKTVAQRPANPRAHEGIAEAYAELGRLEEAITRHAEAVRLQPDEATYHYNHALALARVERWEEAILGYQRSLRLAPQEAKTHNNLAIALGRAGRTEAALAHYAEAERLNPREAQFPYNHGIALQRLGQLPAALARYETALRMRPDFPDAHFNLGSVLARLRRFDAALSHYEAALRSRPADPEYRTTLAGALVAAGRPDAALEHYRTVLAAQPAYALAHFGLGNALAALRRPDDAIASYRAALRSAPDHANTHFKLGNALLDTDRVADAVPHYETAVRLDPADAEAHHNLGIAYARLDRLAEAGRAFVTALRLRPDYPEARRHLDQVRAVLGR